MSMTSVLAVKKKSPMTEREIVKLIRTGQGDRSLREYAAEIGISGAYLSEIYNGKRSPGRKCLEHFGITKQRRVIYEFSYEV